jgi:hypothetical protein
MGNMRNAYLIWVGKDNLKNLDVHGRITLERILGK